MKPNSRKEQFLQGILDGDASGLPKPITREETYLKAIAENQGGGGGGTTNYNALSNKPKVNNVELVGNSTLEALGIQKALTAGDNIEIASDGTINATDTKYEAGEGIEIDENNVISATGGGGGGDASLTTDVTANMNVGAIKSGETVEEGTTFTEFVQKLLITEIAPETTFSASGSGVKEVGTSVTPTYTLNITSVGTGTPTSIDFYRGSTKVSSQPYVEGTNSYSFTDDPITSNVTVKGVLNYTKSDGTTTATVEKSATYTFVMASYYGAVTTAPTTKEEIIALTKNVKTGKGQTATFNLSNQRSCYCYPASFGNLTSIKDANNFEYLSSYTKTTVAVDGVDYNVYTLTDPVTATGFKQIYA